VRSFKPHWKAGKWWLFYWDEEKVWVLIAPMGQQLHFSKYKEAVELIKSYLNDRMSAEIRAEAAERGL
jgi:hypothetical protein